MFDRRLIRLDLGEGDLLTQEVTLSLVVGGIDRSLHQQGGEPVDLLPEGDHAPFLAGPVLAR